MIKAITRIDPNAQVTVSDNDFSKIIWHDGNPNNITLEQVQAAQVEIQAEYDAQEYARNRKAEYPPIGDQLDALFHAGVFPADMAATLQAVKDKYPR